MTKEDIINVCSKTSYEDLAHTYKKSELTQMYKCLYGITPQSRKTSKELAYSIWSFVQDHIRTLDLCKIFS